MVYAIFEDFFPDVEKKLNHIAKKCKKHGNDFTFSIEGEEIREIQHEDDLVAGHYKFILVNVEGTAKINDWECIAVLEINKVGNIIRRINTEIDIPERFKTSENICEHCNSNRSRKNLYVIHNVVTDEWKQVGGSCLKLYTNGLNMEYVAAYLDGITELEENDGLVGGCGGQKYYEVGSVIGRAVEIINQTGYFSSQAGLPTKTLVSTIVCDKWGHGVDEVNKLLAIHKFAEVYFRNSDFYKEETNETVSKIIEYYMGLEDNSEFVHNVQVMLKEGYVASKNFGFLCYLPEGYAKHIQREIEKAKRLEEKSEYFGEVGKRYKDQKISCVELLSSWYNDYGVTRLYKIVLEGGFVLTWKSSKDIDCEDDEVPDTITFTVKAHSEYKGKNQTEVTRCKVTYKKA